MLLVFKDQGEPGQPLEKFIITDLCGISYSVRHTFLLVQHVQCHFTFSRISLDKVNMFLAWPGQRSSERISSTTRELSPHSSSFRVQTSGENL